jgi:hypothetical protein
LFYIGECVHTCESDSQGRGSKKESLKSTDQTPSAQMCVFRENDK